MADFFPLCSDKPHTHATIATARNNTTAYSSGVVMVSMDAEDRKSNVDVWILVVDASTAM